MVEKGGFVYTGLSRKDGEYLLKVKYVWYGTSGSPNSAVDIILSLNNLMREFVLLNYLIVILGRLLER